VTPSNQTSKKGLLLLNLGTPDSVQTPDVRKYLAEFLMDPFVIDIPFLFRFLLIYGIILPSRPKKSAEAYEKIWNERGSPLRFHLEDLKQKVDKNLAAQQIQVRSAMRYGSPSLREALEQFKQDQVEEVVVFPLYPQYSLAATESSIQKVKSEAHLCGFSGRLKFVPPFFSDSGFIEAFGKEGDQALQDFKYDHILFSFHGLPERHCRKTDRSGSHCFSSPDCCAQVSDVNRDCYRAQCFATAHAIARELGMGTQDFGKRYSVSFQSRLGRTPWIRPYTDLIFSDLVKQGVKKLAVMCPSFVADCLETLEEIQIRGRDSFLAVGGEDLRLVPSLNSSDKWAEAVCELVNTAVDSGHV
jgi:ferrochelatase